MRILIVEDEEVVARLMAILIKSILENFPGSEITVVQHLSKALELIRRVPPPDVVVLDLSLKDSTMEQTIAKIGEINNRCAVVIATGHSKAEVEKYLPDGIDFLEKKDMLKDKSTLSRLILSAVIQWKKREFEPINRNIGRMAELLEKITPHGSEK